MVAGRRMTTPPLGARWTHGLGWWPGWGNGGLLSIGGKALALQGTLDTFSLPDVLRLLATTTKTGRLRIEGDRGQGSVWLRDGTVVDIDADRSVDGAPPDEVIFELLRFESGSFAFETDERTPNAEHPDDVEGLLRRASALLSEWTELETVVPSSQHRVTLCDELASDEVTIDADRWRSIVALASGRSVAELASALGLSELNASRAVRDLVELGVADVAPPGDAPSPARRPTSTSDLHRRGAGPVRPAPVPPNGVTPRPEPVASGDGLRAGWRHAPDRTTGAQPPVTSDPRPSAPRASNGQGRPSLGDAARGRGANPSSANDGPQLRRGRSRSAASPEAESLGPPAPGPVPNPGPVPRSTPAERDTGLSSRLRPGSAATPSGRGPATTTSGLGGEAPRTPTTGSTALGGGPSPFDAGRLGPPASIDTGQIRAVSSSALPPDLHWAADDVRTGPTTGPITSPFTGLTSLGGSRPPTDGEVAPHLAAMSPEARAAVQSSVGNAGGAVPAHGPVPGDDSAQRGRLINFLSSVR
jgi:hypothetical protein